MSYRDLTGELIGMTPRLGFPNAARILNTAWSQIQDMRLWSFNIVSDGQLFCPDAVTAGSISATFNSNVLTADATAKAALNAVQLSNPLLAGELGIGRQIRIGSFPVNSPSGPMYTVISYDNATGAITVDRPYGETTGTGFNYQCYKAYYSPAVSGTVGGANPKFVRYFTIINSASGYSIRGRHLYYTQAQLNAIDPQRSGQQIPYILAYKGHNSLGQPVHELYPAPVSFVTLIAMFQIKWSELSANSDLPQMPYDLRGLVMYKAKALAAEWALANVAAYPELQQTNWVALQALQDKNFKDTRLQCIKQDDEIKPQLPTIQGNQFSFPLGGQFLQGHDISSIISG